MIVHDLCTQKVQKYIPPSAKKSNTNNQNARNEKKKIKKVIAYAFRLKKLSYRNLEKKNNIRLHTDITGL